jgi:adenosylmethionine-8-amino-7-oxononanoate aminotransferase
MRLKPPCQRGGNRPLRRYNDPTIMTAELKSTPVTAALQRELVLRPIGRTIYRMPPYCLSDDEMTLLAARTLDFVPCA